MLCSSGQEGSRSVLEDSRAVVHLRLRDKRDWDTPGVNAAVEHFQSITPKTK